MKIFIALITVLISTSAFAIDPTAGLPASVKDRHLQVSGNDCQTDTFEGQQTYDLEDGAKLYIVPCGFGAYQGFYYVYSSNKFDGVNSVIVLSYDEITKGISASIELTTAQYDYTRQELTTFAKGRGVGDCGQSSVSKVTVQDGYVYVKTTEIRAKTKCDGKHTSWPVVFTQ